MAEELQRRSPGATACSSWRATLEHCAQPCRYSSPLVAPQRQRSPAQRCAARSAVGCWRPSPQRQCHGRPRSGSAAVATGCTTNCCLASRRREPARRHVCRARAASLGAGLAQERPPRGRARRPRGCAERVASSRLTGCAQGRRFEARALPRPRGGAARRAARRAPPRFLPRGSLVGPVEPGHRAACGGVRLPRGSCMGSTMRAATVAHGPPTPRPAGQADSPQFSNTSTEARVLWRGASRRGAARAALPTRMVTCSLAVPDMPTSGWVWSGCGRLARRRPPHATEVWFTHTRGSWSATRSVAGCLARSLGSRCVPGSFGEQHGGCEGTSARLAGWWCFWVPILTVGRRFAAEAASSAEGDARRTAHRCWR